MRKIDSSLLVCTADQSAQIVALGIVPAAAMCYEWILKTDFDDDGFLEKTESGEYEFVGEYMGQENCIPAWTQDELNILIGGEFEKPDLYTKADWYESANMMRYIVYLPKVRKEFQNGAEAYAEYLIALIIEKKIEVSEANTRLEAFISKEPFNPMTDNLSK